MSKPLPIWMLVGIACLGSSSIWAEDTTSVVLNHSDIELHYEQAVRLDKVLLDALQQDNHRHGLHTYHEGFRLFSDKKQSQADVLYVEVATQLNALLSDDDYRMPAQQLLTQLKHYQYGFREHINLDVDVVRMHEELNPRLQGQYHLQLMKRPNTVMLFGLPKDHVPFHATSTVADYIQQSQPTQKRHHSYAWVITPSGDIERVGYAYWNNESTHLMPGSALLVGFDSKNNDMIELEENIAKLISMIKGKAQ